MNKLQFTTKSAAKKATGISYLGGVNHSAKSAHGIQYGIDTYIVYLAPGKQSGCINVCPGASPECLEACLHNAGKAKLEDLAGINTIKQCRINRTKLFHYNQDFFMAWVIAEIASAKVSAAKKNHIFAVRLNGTSDIKFENIRYQGRTIFEIFPTVTFYDYTKLPGRDIANIVNYSLTFSYTGRNGFHSLQTLKSGNNVAIVFDVKRGEDLPEFWNGFAVLDGDITDYRPADRKSCVVGLRFKLAANKANNEAAKNSVFVVDPMSDICSPVNEYNQIAAIFGDIVQLAG